MNSRDDVAFRLGLGQGFLKEARQDVEIERWRSCVDNAQLCVEMLARPSSLFLKCLPRPMPQPMSLRGLRAMRLFR